jgi:hypothetical protein
MDWRQDLPTLPSLRFPLPARAPVVVNPAWARRLLWLTFWLIVAAVGIGGTWDGLWHATHPFDGFFSPPHIFVYATCMLAGAVVFVMTVTPAVRMAFGTGAGLPLGVPGPLLLVGGGLAVAGLAGLVLDNFWHTTFGLDETGWSFPHAMLGWSVLLVSLGFAACRLALRPGYPTRWWTHLLIALLALGSGAVIMGPLFVNRTPEIVRDIASIPALAAQPPFRHAARILITWNLTRENPLLIVLAPLWAGASLGFAQALDRRWWLVLLAVLLWSAGDNAHGLAELHSRQYPGLLDPRNWRELPLLAPTLVVLALPRLRLPETWAYLLGGALFGVLIGVTWDATPAALMLALPAAPVMLLGKRLGERTFAVVARPTSFAPIFSIFAFAVSASCLTGLIDLYLRLTTP